jgi:hypothetical protein
LTGILTDEELQQFDRPGIHKIDWLETTIENKIVELMAQVISGETAAITGLDQARRIVETARALEEHRGDT